MRYSNDGGESFGRLSPTPTPTFTSPYFPAPSFGPVADSYFMETPVGSGSGALQPVDIVADSYLPPDRSTGLFLGPGQSYGSGVSRVGPTASGPLRGAVDPNVRAGSLFSGGLPTQANFRAARGYMAQRGFIARMQDALRRRKRGLLR